MFVGDRRAKALTLGAMCFALFMAMLDNTVVNVALPAIQRDLGSGVSGLQWIVDAYTLAFASLMLTGGTLGDIYGRKRAFLSGLVIFTAGSLTCGLAPGLGVLVAARALQGIGAAALIPGTLSILTNTFPDPRERAQAIGIWAGVSGLALAAGPVLGGTLVDTFGWQSVFFLNVPVGIVALVVASRVVVESKNPEGRRVDLPGQTLAVIALGSLTYALIEGNDLGWRSAVIVTLLVVAALTGIAFLLIERRSTSPMLQLQFFRNPTFSAAATVAALVSFGMFGMLFFISLFFQNVQRYSAAEAGIRFLPQTLAIVVTAPLAGRLAGRIGSRWPMAIGLAMVGAGLLLFTGIGGDTGYGHIWWILLMMGVGLGLTMTPMTAAVMGSVPRARAGMASAVTNTSREVGGVFGIALLGAIVTGRLTSTLTDRLTTLGVSAAARSRIVDLAVHGELAQLRSVRGVRPQVLAQVPAAVGDSFVTGMHTALVLAGFALLAGAAVAVAFVRPLQPVESELGGVEGVAAAAAAV